MNQTFFRCSTLLGSMYSMSCVAAVQIITIYQWKRLSVDMPSGVVPSLDRKYLNEYTPFGSVSLCVSQWRANPAMFKSKSGPIFKSKSAPLKKLKSFPVHTNYEYKVCKKYTFDFPDWQRIGRGVPIEQVRALETGHWQDRQDQFYYLDHWWGR